MHDLCRGAPANRLNMPALFRAKVLAHAGGLPDFALVVPQMRQSSLIPATPRVQLNPFKRLSLNKLNPTRRNYVLGIRRALSTCRAVRR